MTNAHRLDVGGNGILITDLMPPPIYLPRLAAASPSSHRRTIGTWGTRQSSNYGNIPQRESRV